MNEMQNLPADIKVIDRPWCSQCEQNSAYLHTWSSVQRPDMDGRSYNEVIEDRMCKACNQEMVFIKDLRLLNMGVNLVCLFVWTALFLIWVYLFPLGPYLIFGILFNFILIFLLRLFTRRSRGIVSKWEKWYEIEKIKKKNPDL
jgi:hypothetical protein